MLIIIIIIIITIFITYYDRSDRFEMLKDQFVPKGD